ncbi:VOC family protein [Mycolicibacterium houstonense]|uniref:VOC family protein n=1 Tax=Mycolicibacterium houstonense TaxID=146021 RepID=UPI00082A82F0|nr:glyoxalase [Mycolicibacterium houstonense]
MTVTLDAIDVADAPESWARAGFSVDSRGTADPLCRIGGVRIRLRDQGTGILGWSLRGLPWDAPVEHLDGIPTTSSDRATTEPATHPNGVIAIDHVVLMSADLDRTVASLAKIGVAARRERDGELGGRRIRQIFFRLGEVILEVVGSPESTGDGASTLWGITYVATDLDATARFFGDCAGPVKDAVQPGRRITTLRHRDLGMTVPTAVISATPRR